MSNPVESSSAVSTVVPSDSSVVPSTTASSVININPSASNQLARSAAVSNFAAAFKDPPARPQPPRPDRQKAPVAQQQGNPHISKSVPNLPLPQKGKTDEDDLPRGPPPKREVEQSHHHHHIIPVDSETDFDKMHVDENKVNYLPYNPPVAVSQTGLIQSIGKPFNPNHAKNLPDPGDEFKLTRRVSQVRLDQIKILGDVNPTVVNGLAASLKLCSILIGVSGLVFFVFVITVGSVSTPMEYPLYFLDSNPICKAVHIIGAVQPFAVAPYCRYALVNLKHVRSYFLRVPLSLVIPSGVIVCGVIQFTNTVVPEGDLESFLLERMAQYFRNTYISTFAKSTWDGIQNSFDCCGYTGPTDWIRYNSSFCPKSCCTSETSCGYSSKNLKPGGCKSSYKASNITIATVYIGLGITIIVLEVLSVIFMRSLYGVIGKELYDERSSLSIMWGKICSLCDIDEEDTDEEIEYDEIVEQKSSGETGKQLKKESSVKSIHSTGSTASGRSGQHTNNIVRSSSVVSEGVGRGRGRGMGRGNLINNKVAPEGTS